MIIRRILSHLFNENRLCVVCTQSSSLSRVVVVVEAVVVVVEVVVVWCILKHLTHSFQFYKPSRTRQVSFLWKIYFFDKKFSFWTQKFIFLDKRQREEGCSLVYDYRPLDQLGQHVKKKKIFLDNLSRREMVHVYNGRFWNIEHRRL